MIRKYHDLIMNCLLKHLILFATACSFFSCNKDNIPDPYQPVNLPDIRRVDFISGNDSSVYIFDNDMILSNGRTNNVLGITGFEWFTMHYSDSKLLTGATYDVARQFDARRDYYEIMYTRDERNMLSKVDREEWTKTLSFTYGDNYLLKQVMVRAENGYEERYTITYSGFNVSSVEKYLNQPNEQYIKTEYSGYEKHNPFRFLVNVFYTPLFSSTYGAVRYDNIPFGMFLSANNPKQMTEYMKDENGEYVTTGNSATFSYEYGEDNYPILINGGGLNLEIKYYQP